MHGGFVRRSLHAVAALGLLLGAAACTEEKIQYVERPAFNPPPDLASGFLGYYTASEKQTTCGNCHVAYQASWEQTVHSNAYEDLEASGGAQDFCRPCHTVSELGNAVDSVAGWHKVADTAYFDVQCESCHGPGLGHIEGPEATKPLASIAIPDSLETATNGCGECHQGEHHPFVEEWMESKHGYGGEAYIEEGNRDPCKNCHEGREAIRVAMGGLDPKPSGTSPAAGNTTSYLEKGVAGLYQPITCAVCHDPHDKSNEGQLRAPLDEVSTEQLCVRCHQREGEPPASGITRRGPHAAQGLIVVDELAGWLPPNWTHTGKLVGSHAIANPRGCAACHLAGFTINDGSGNFVKNYTGHLFEAIPCIDQATGEPVPGGDCGEDERYFGGCTTSGCHGSVAATRTAFEVVRNRINTLTDALWDDVDNDSLMESTDDGLLAQILAQAVANNNRRAINLFDSTLTAAEGAIWNAQLASTSERPNWRSFKIPEQYSCASRTCTTQSTSSNTAHASSGQGVHNPFLLEALLTSTIAALVDAYDLAPPAVDLSVQAAVPPGVRSGR